MKYWLFKSEPESWSWDNQVAAGKTGESWDGVRNYQANNNMKAMEIGDRGFFYHSVKEKQIVGIVEVCATHYLDDTDPKGRFSMVDIRAIEPMVRPVTLAQVKNDPRLSTMQLVTHSRLSVQEVSPEHWSIILQLSATPSES